MTAPDPGLTDLLAAHAHLPQFMRCSCGDDLWKYPEGGHPAHVALVVEQHTNRRIAKVNARARARVKAANKRASIRITQIRKEESARFEAKARAEKAEENARAWSETYRGGIRVRDEWKSRAEEYAATIADIRTLAVVLSHSMTCPALIEGICTCVVGHLRAALEEEQ